MSNRSHFESRKGRLSSKAEQAFYFITDIRHFEQFAPKGTITNWSAEKESCSFTVPMLGKVAFRLVEKEKFSKVVFEGDALNKNDFTLAVLIMGNDNENAEVKVQVSADLNPVFKAVADKPIRQFMELLITEMEKFRDWDKVNE
jgi:hypothetical protein